ncbi:MAG TPA: DEAD/DEAH box helicase family protein, partial [Vicinamibacterales bacterium]|nr:DEAD/DEAH box helicase family protein [Vicinamibacterales bacterium]
MSNPFFDRPIVNSPYECPRQHWELDEAGMPTGHLIEKRRRAEFVTPIPKPKKRRAARQEELGLDEGRGLSSKRQAYDLTSIINEVRQNVDAWRALAPSQWQVTPETARLLQHWRHHEFGSVRPFFCQVEAVETAIWLTEVAPHLAAGKRLLEYLKAVNADANPNLERLALKLATGAGKTTVMAMLIAWQTLNAVRRQGSKHFTRGFLIVAPGLTIKDRLRVLQPNDPDNYYATRELVPHELLEDIKKARIVITNYHALKRRERIELSAGGRALLEGRTGPELQTLETEGQMLQRVMPELMGMKHVLVLNDEAHHCYREKPPDPEDEALEALKGDERREAEKNNEAARLWISGLETVNRTLGLTRVLDLSATPFFLRGSGYEEGTLFPWTMSDFSLMDAIECGIVKLPRVPVAENIPGDEMPVYRNLWEHIRKDMPKKRRGAEGDLDPLKLPTRLRTALEALYGHYAKTFDLWRQRGISVPPCFIVVCQNTAVSKLVYDYVSGFERRQEDGTSQIENGKLALFRNFDDTTLNPLPRPNTLLIDSEELESGEALDDRFRAMAADEIERFRREIGERTGEARAADGITDQELLREVMNTVGKKDQLGAGIRCVVSVSMLTEGWDANNVTHILGIRAFGTQLLCEQVIGRALRRQSYDLNEEGLFDAEYADIFGVPFDFTAKPVVAPPNPPRETVQVKAVRAGPGSPGDPIPTRRGLPRRASNRTARGNLQRGLGDGADARSRRADEHPQSGHHRRGGGSDRRAPRRREAVHAPVQPDEAPDLQGVARARRGSEAAVVRSVQAHHETVARHVSRLQRRHVPGNASVRRSRRRGLQSDHGRHYQRASGSAPDQGHGRSQPVGFDGSCTLSDFEARSLGHERSAAEEPRELGGVRQPVGSGILPRRRGARASVRIHEESQSGIRGALPLRIGGPPLSARLHRARGRRAWSRRSAAAR